MREDLEWEAAEEEGLQHLYDELGPQWARDHAPEIFAENYDDAVRQFTAERLVSYYVDHKTLAQPAHDALQYAKSLQIERPRAAIVFAATSIEVTIKDVLLRPIVYGLVHNDSLAEYVANLSVAKRGGAATFAELLNGVFHNLVGVDFPSFKRTGSALTLLKEMESVNLARNKIVHAAEVVHDGKADTAIDVASALLYTLFPMLLEKLKLHLHDPVTICDLSHRQARQ